MSKAFYILICNEEAKAACQCGFNDRRNSDIGSEFKRKRQKCLILRLHSVMVDKQNRGKEHWCNENYRLKSDVLGEKDAPVPVIS
jgi:hypothetical protein